MRPATSQKPSSFLPGRACTLRIGRWQRRAGGNSLRRKSTDKRPPVCGSCAFSFERLRLKCLRRKRILERAGSAFWLIFIVIVTTLTILHFPNHLAQHAEKEFRVAGLQMKPPHQTADSALKRI